MINDIALQYRDDEIDRNAFNAAFNELGFRWHWCCDTYSELRSQSQDAALQIRHYLETRQPHLLRAYDAEFLVQMIKAKTAEHRQRATAPGAFASGHFNWAETLGREIGI